MDIWMFNHYAITPNTGGITRDYDIAKRLTEQGHRVTIFASSFDHRTRKETHIDNNKDTFKEEYYNNIRYIWVKTTAYEGNNIKRVLNILSYSWRGLFVSKKVSGTPDIVIGTLVHPFAALLGYIIARRNKSIYYFEERDLWPETLIHLGKLSKKNPAVFLLSKLELFLYKKAKRIIVLFDKAPLYVEQRGIDKNKVLYMPNGVDLQNYMKKDVPPTEVDQIFEHLKDKFIAIYTGAHGLANRLDVILDAAKIIKSKNPHIHFLLVGDGVEKTKLMKRKEEEGLENVTFVDPIPKEYIPSVIKKANVGLIAMWDAELYKWGISLNKAYDYMAGKLPTIIQCNIKDTIIEKSNGGIRVNNAEQMADALQYSYESPEEIRKMGESGFEFVATHHSWDEMVKVLLNAMTEDTNIEQHLVKERG